MECEVRIHRGYAEFDLLREEGIIDRQLFGKYQFIWTSPKGKISMIQQLNIFGDGSNYWEIYCLEGNLFEYTERFTRRQEAEQRVRELLNG